MRKYSRSMLVAISAVAAFGALTGCSGSSTTETAASAQPEPTTTGGTSVPESARYMADMESADGQTMTIGISVDGADVAAYACNGTDDEAWFFGSQTDGATDLKSRFRDTMQAQFDGAVATGAVTMDGVTFDFTANEVSGLAGMYTAESDGVRASWVVRPDGTATGVQFSGFSEGDRNFDPFNLDEFSDFDVRNDVRPRRNLQPAGPIEFSADGQPQASINGAEVTPDLVTGSFRLG